MSQRARILWVIVLAIAPLVVLSGVGLWQQVKHEESRIAAERLQLAEAAAVANAPLLEGPGGTGAAPRRLPRGTGRHRRRRRPAPDHRPGARAQPRARGVHAQGRRGALGM